MGEKKKVNKLRTSDLFALISAIVGMRDEIQTRQLTRGQLLEEMQKKFPAVTLTLANLAHAAEVAGVKFSEPKPAPATDPDSEALDALGAEVDRLARNVAGLSARLDALSLALNWTLPADGGAARPALF